MGFQRMLLPCFDVSLAFEGRCAVQVCRLATFSRSREQKRRLWRWDALVRLRVFKMADFALCVLYRVSICKGTRNLFQTAEKSLLRLWSHACRGFSAIRFIVG